jgi:EAL domain-containing protein (putative c-di-GMP-specific phosphodiesterase class I)/CheY-like chemotaxis protein
MNADCVSAATLKVLLVDDDMDLLRVMRRSLSDSGLDVLTAENVDQALMILRSTHVEVVVSDLMMPGRTGLDLLRALRPEAPDLPVILLTGHPGLETAVSAVELGASHYLRKPVEARVLRECVHSAARAYRATARGRDPGASGASSTRPRGIATLERALERGIETLELFVQPVFHAATRVRLGWEALVRTSASEVRDPRALFAVAERLERVTEVGRKIREEAARLLAHLPEGLLFINLHPEELLDEGLYALDAPLAPHASRIVFEVTERAAIGRGTHLAERCGRLRELGYRIAVDDLGAGYAALSAVADLRPHVVKLDMSLVRGVADDRVRQGVIGSVVEMCGQLGIWTVAEGVESERELEALVWLGCGFVQGYHLGRPAAWEVAAA